MPTVLFVCTANQFRSPLAAACFSSVVERQALGDEWLVESAGTWTQDGIPALSIAQKNAERLGIRGLEHHRSRQVSAELLGGYDLIVVMESGHKEALIAEFKPVRARIFMLSEIVDGIQYDIPDPVAPGNHPEDISAELYSMINQGAKKIIDLARVLHSARQVEQQGDSKK
jgi:protein-tyrosine phosphatase